MTCNSSKLYYTSQLYADIQTYNYLDKLDNKNRKTSLTLLIDNGKYNRICNVCNYDIGGEYYYILKCSHFNDDRKQYLPNRHISRPDSLKFSSLSNTRHI